MNGVGVRFLRPTPAPISSKAMPMTYNDTFKVFPDANGIIAAMRNRLPAMMNPTFP